VISGQTPLNFYSNLVSSWQRRFQRADRPAVRRAGAQANPKLAGRRFRRRHNEEAANLIRFQNAYQASAQVSSVIDTLMQTTINLIR